MMKAPTLSDVAARAGVSYATADRVLNGRGGVAPKSVEKVNRAVCELGYVRNVAAANLSQNRIYRFAFVIPTGDNAFFTRVRELVNRTRDLVKPERVAVTIKDVAPFDPAALGDLLSRIEDEGYDGLAVVGSEGAGVVAALRDLRESGTAVVTLVSDVEPDARDFYVGIDNLSAGRTAARLIGLAHGGRPGRVQPVLGALQARDHRDRLQGFRDTLHEHFPQLSLAPEIEGRDRHDIVEDRLGRALQGDPGITAIYSLGAGNSGLFRLLERLPAERPRPVAVVHELAGLSRRALETGLIDVVIDQRPEDEIRLALGILRQVSDRRTVAPPQPIVPAIYVKENLPPEIGLAQQLEIST